jgi:hypothetical protein
MLSLIWTLGLRPFILCRHLLIMNKIKTLKNMNYVPHHQ